MKLLRIAILTVLLPGCLAAAAQLAAPDDPSQAPAVPAAPDSVAAPIVQPRHNTPSESFRNERNAIRRGNAEFADSNYYRALEYYQEALRENASSLAARYNYATTLLHLSSEDSRGTQNDPRVKAAQIYQELIPDARRFRPEIAEKALYNLGNMSYNDANYGQAIACYERSLMLNPDNAECRYNLRMAQLQQENQQNNQNNQNQQEQEQQQQEQQQQQQEQQQQEQQQQEQQQQQMTQSAQQILQSMQNKENETRRRVNEVEAEPGRRRQPDKPW